MSPAGIKESGLIAYRELSTIVVGDVVSSEAGRNLKSLLRGRNTIVHVPVVAEAVVHLPFQSPISSALPPVAVIIKVSTWATLSLLFFFLSLSRSIF